MNFALTDEQQMIIKTTKDFVANELYPHEKEVEETGKLRPELRDELKVKAIAAGLYAANIPAEGGGV
jgi:acyl-CoA dehydrogenase